MLCTTKYSFLIGLAIVCLCASISIAEAESNANSPIDPQKLIREVVSTELKADKTDNSHWMFREQDIEPGKNVVQECVQTRQGQICRVLARDGHPLSAEERDQEKRRVDALVHNPAEEKKRQRQRHEDDQRADDMLNMLPAGFLYQYDGQEGKLVRLKFHPNPTFNPPSREGAVFHGMAGIMLLDPQAKRLVELKGSLIRTVDFGWGLLGHLDKGGTFNLRRQNVGGDHWENTLLDVHIRGKALFFKTINTQQHQVDEDFKRVPDGLTLAQGASMLEAPNLQARAQATQH
ncbi:MAG TPA: hypothetical protein VFI95_00510 [Terriglobales bacterium]|nr:hypothetical protein [Terriglobales bacterium]